MTPDELIMNIKAICTQQLAAIAGTGTPGEFIHGMRQDESFLSTFKQSPLINLLPFEFEEDLLNKIATGTLELRCTWSDTLASSVTQRQALVKKAYALMHNVCLELSNGAFVYDDGTLDSFKLDKISFRPLYRENAAIASGYAVRIPLSFDTPCDELDVEDGGTSRFLLLESGPRILLEP